MAKFIEVHKGDAPYLLNLDDISSITAFGGETCFWHRFCSYGRIREAEE